MRLLQQTARFSNSDRGVVIGDFPWYEMVWRSLRGDFRPLREPVGGYDQFARFWSVTIDHGRIARRQIDPVVTWLGHVSILLQVAGLNLLFDPTLARFAGPYGLVGAPRRVPAPLAADQLPRIDAVLISHNHYDHLCHDTIARLMRSGQQPRIFVPSGLKSWFDSRNIGQVIEMQWWGEAALGSALRVHFTPSQHWSRRTPWDTNASLWGGYMLVWERSAAPPWRFFFPGDTGYSKDFVAIRQRLGAVDFLALPIGVYLPRDFMRDMHVNPADAVQVMLDLDAKQAMAVHWGTFVLSQEAFDQPPQDLAAALSERGLSSEAVWLLRHGESRAIPL